MEWAGIVNNCRGYIEFTEEYKRKIGGDLVEFIGEFDLINKPFWYIVLPTLLKIYRKIKK